MMNEKVKISAVMGSIVKKGTFGATRIEDHMPKRPFNKSVSRILFSNSFIFDKIIDYNKNSKTFFQKVVSKKW